MLINNPEALKSWLVVVLDPLCDADSSALARYVLALLKKDKPEKELKKVMIEQLDVFLGDETTPFVERLLEAINSEEYLLPPAPVVAKVEIDDTIAIIHPPIEGNAIKTEFQQETATEVNVEETLPGSAYLDNIQTPSNDDNKTKDNHNNNYHKSNDASEQRSTTAHYSTAKVTTPAIGNHVRSASPPAKAVNTDKDLARESRRRRASLRSRSRSRSRSNERSSRRSRSRDRRPKEGDKNQRQFRNKSPPNADMGGRHGMNSHDRRRGGGSGNDRRRLGGGAGGGGGGGGGTTNIDDRSPRFAGITGGGESNGGARKGRANRSKSRSRSASAERGSRSKVSPNTMRSSGLRANSPERGDRHRHHHSNVQQQQQQQQLQLHEAGEKRQRCRDFDEKGYCVRGETCPWDHGVNPVVFEGINNSTLISMSLREYNPDSPDLWARSANSGGMVAGGGSQATLVGGGPAGMVGGGTGVGVGVGGGATAVNPFSGSVRPGLLVGGYPHLVDKVVNGVAGTLAADYARSAASGVGFRAAAPMLPFPFNPAAVATPLQRELIPIPVVDAGPVGGVGGDVGAHMQQGKRRFELEDSVAIAEGPTKRKLPIGSRLGPRMPNMQNNCSLELRKVPRGLNTIAHLNNHFAKFGKIVNIQISYDGDPEAAIVTFSTHAEANVAYRSTEAVLNNRFIKVFWHSQDAGAAQTNDTNTIPMSGGRKNSQYHLNNVPAIPTPSADSAKTTNIAAVASQNALTAGSVSNSIATPAAPGTETTAASGTVVATHVPPPSLRLKNNVTPRTGLTAANSINIRKKQEEQAKAVVQLANGLRKRKQELLQSYVKQMKSALELIERSEPNDPQRAKTVETIKILQETIEKLRKEIAAEQEQMQAQIQNQQPSQGPPPPKKTKEQQKKELLDIELELIAQQQEGNDTTTIQKRLEELQRSLGVVPNSSATGLSATGGGKSGAHFPATRNSPRMRASYPEGPTRVDRRPKTIVVTGFTSEEADFVLGHFKHFGEITKHDVDKDIPQIILSYATRVNAEQAVLRGKLFKDKRLQITWAPVVPNAAAPGTAGTPLVGDTKMLDGDYKMSTSIARKDSAGELVDGGGNSITGDTLPELRLEDEEEDEESEDRSWRR